MHPRPKTWAGHESGRRPGLPALWQERNLKPDLWFLGAYGGCWGEEGHIADECSDHRPQPERNQAQNRLSLGASAGIRPFQRVTAQAFCLPSASAHIETKAKAVWAPCGGWGGSQRADFEVLESPLKHCQSRQLRQTWQNGEGIAESVTKRSITLGTHPAWQVAKRGWTSAGTPPRQASEFLGVCGHPALVRAVWKEQQSLGIICPPGLHPAKLLFSLQGWG